MGHLAERRIAKSSPRGLILGLATLRLTKVVLMHDFIQSSIPPAEPVVFLTPAEPVVFLTRNSALPLT